MTTSSIHAFPDSTYVISAAEAAKVEAQLFAPRGRNTASMATSRAGALVGLVGIFGLIAFGLFLPCSIAAVVLGIIGRRRDGIHAFQLWMLAMVSGSVGIGITALGAFLAFPQFR